MKRFPITELLALCAVQHSNLHSTIIPTQKFRLMMSEEVFEARVMCDISHKGL